MTKDQLIELFQYRLSGIPTISDKSKHPEIISFMIGLAFNQMIGELNAKGYKNLSPYSKLFINIDVVYNSDIDVYYSLLPIDISTLTDVKSGIRKIQSMQGKGLEFAPMDRERLEIIEGLDVSSLTDIIGYTIGKNEDGDLAVDYFGMTSENYITHVKMYLLIPFEAYEDDDIINLPAGQDAMLFDMVVKLFNGQPPKDMKDNHNEIKY